MGKLKERKMTNVPRPPLQKEREVLSEALKATEMAAKHGMELDKRAGKGVYVTVMVAAASFEDHEC